MGGGEFDLSLKLVITSIKYVNKIYKFHVYLYFYKYFIIINNLYYNELSLN